MTSPEEIKRAMALFFDAIDEYRGEDPYACGYWDRDMRVLDGKLDEIMPALLMYGWTPPAVDPLPQSEREQPAPPVETWSGPVTFGPLNEGDTVVVNYGGKRNLFKVDRQRGSSITHGLTRMECTRVDGDEQISVDLDRRERLQQIAANMPIVDAPIGFVDDGVRLVQDPDTGEQTWVKP